MKHGIGSPPAAFASLLVLTAVWTACGQAEHRDPAVVKDRYQTAMSHLDAGGDTLLIMNMERAIEDFMAFVTNVVSTIPATDAEAAAVKTAVPKLHAFLSAKGLYSARSFGLSSVPKGDGMNTVKMFVGRDAAAAALPFWKGFSGANPRKLGCLDLAPADAALVRAHNASLPDIWKLVRDGIAQVASPNTAASFNAALAAASAQLGMPLDRLIASASDEIMISVQLSKDKSISLPMPDMQMFDIPEPSVLFALKVKDGSILKLIESQLATNQIPLASKTVEQVNVKSMSLPIPFPIPIQLSFAQCGDYFLFGSSEKVVSDAISSAGKKNGLATSAEFVKAFAGLPAMCNGLAYVSPRFSKLIADIQSRALQANKDPEAKPVLAAVLKMFESRSGQPEAFVFVNMKDGVSIQGNSASGGREIAVSMAVAPMGLMAAIAIPSFAKARTSARGNACINNLRMIDSAKEQWALDNDKDDGDEPTADDLKKYLPRGAFPVCPQGGVYQINAIGKDPKCSIGKHSLPR